MTTQPPTDTDDATNTGGHDAGGVRVSRPPTCMYGYPHPGEEHECEGFACHREEHARAAVFGR